VSTPLFDDLISQAEAARLRGVSRQAISNLVRDGKLKTYEVAGRPLLSRKEVLNYESPPTGRPRKNKED
jgi:excisionase family DNA binding protein